MVFAAVTVQGTGRPTCDVQLRCCAGYSSSASGVPRRLDMCVIACKVYVSDFASSVLSARPAIPRFGTQQVADMKDSLCLFFFKERIPDDPSISLRAVQKKLMGQKMINTLTTTDKLSLPLVHEDVGIVRYTTAEPG